MQETTEKLDWIDSLPLNVKDEVMSSMKNVKFSAGQQIYAVGDEHLTIYRIQSGLIRMFLLSTSGTELLLNIFGPGECIGDLGAVGGLASPVFAVAQEEAELLALPHRDYLRLRDKYPQIERAQSRLLATILNRVMLFLQETTSYSLTVRVASRLYWLLESAQSKGDTSMIIKTSQADIAAMVGASRPAVNQIISSLRDRGILKSHYGEIIITESEHLKKIANETEK